MPRWLLPLVLANACNLNKNLYRNNAIEIFFSLAAFSRRLLRRRSANPNQHCSREDSKQMNLENHASRLFAESADDDSSRIIQIAPLSTPIPRHCCAIDSRSLINRQTEAKSKPRLIRICGFRIEFQYIRPVSCLFNAPSVHKFKFSQNSFLVNTETTEDRAVSVAVENKVSSFILVSAHRAVVSPRTTSETTFLQTAIPVPALEIFATFFTQKLRFSAETHEW